MKIKKLKLNNIGVHKELEVEFGEFTTISGGNAKGKTTIDNALIETIEGSNIPLLSNDGETGSIEALFDADSGEYSVRIPFKKDDEGGQSKGQPVIKQGKMTISQPRSQLKEWHNDARIRAIDFFSGEGAKLRKYQEDTIMSILNITLDETELMNCTGQELPLEDFFNVEHPLNYIKRLVNEKDGYYYRKRAKNNEGIQTITHSNNTLYDQISEKLIEADIDPVLFDPEEFRPISVTQLLTELADKQKKNSDIDTACIMIKSIDDRKMALETRRKNAKESLKEEFTKTHGDNIKNITDRIDALKKELAEKEAELKKEQDSFDDELDNKFLVMDERYNIELKQIENEHKTHLETSKVKKVPIEDLQKAVNQTQAVKEILPTYDTWVKGCEEHTNMKEYSDRLTEIITELRALPSKILKREKLPIEGLSMNEDGEFVIVNSHGTPVLLNQLSGFERLKLSLDISIARLGEIRVLIIPQWSEIDKTNQKKIKKYLKSKDVQGIAIEVGEGELKVETE